MRETRLSLPALSLLAGTRAMLGAGLGLLMADRLSVKQKRAVGWTLLLVGIGTTIPLVMEVWRKAETVEEEDEDIFNSSI